MIKVLIVDDEPFIRQGLKILINWEQYGYEIVGEASNGLEAIKELETKEIDLIIVDIKMPEMNGIELIEYVRGNILTEVKFIVLSGYYEFEYAKKAIKCNVTDYILKPIQKDELIKVLSIFKDEYIKREELYAEQKVKDEVTYNGYLSEVIHGKANNYNLEYIKNYNYFSNELRYIIVEINYDNKCESILPDERRKEQQAFYNNMALWLGDNYCNAVINISQYTECYDIGFIYDKRLAQEKRMNEREYILDFKTSMKQIQECDFFAYVGKEVNCIEDIEVSYKSATIAKLVSDFSFDNNITYYDENDEKKEFSCDKGKQYMDCLICKIQDNNKEEIINCIDEMYSSFKEYKVNLDMIKININYLLCNLLNIAQELDSVVNEEQAMQYMRSVSLEQIIIKGRENQLKSFSLEFAEYLSQLRENSFQGILNQIYKEISEHYMEKLSLKYLSEKYYINSAYLGQIFKKQYNVSFNDYLNAYRIEKAAELLKRSDDNIYRISEKVGYNNTDYFINKFVQLKEKTPLQYRKQFRCT